MYTYSNVNPRKLDIKLSGFIMSVKKQNKHDNYVLIDIIKTQQY
mgnify:FL=1